MAAIDDRFGGRNSPHQYPLQLKKRHNRSAVMRPEILETARQEKKRDKFDENEVSRERENKDKQQQQRQMNER